jgi:L-histidine N-alpha-methyltransferase
MAWNGHTGEDNRSLNAVNLLPPGFLECTLREDARSGLTGTPKSLPSKWLYDVQGGVLFEKIMKLPEYYLARAECEILSRAARQIADLIAARTVVELRPGSPGKTRLVLDALRSRGSLMSYVGVHLSESVVTTVADALSAEYPEWVIRAIVTDFEEHLGLPGYPASGPTLVMFLGSALGNMLPAQRAAFLARVRARLFDGDALLLGVDLIKAPSVTVAAYNDRAGATVAFNKNILAVLNFRLSADFDPDAFDHVAVWVPETEWIEMRLRSAVVQQVRVPGAGLTVPFAAGEEMRTEISARFRRDRIEAELAAAGFAVRGWWTDASSQFAVSLSVPV